MGPLNLPIEPLLDPILAELGPGRRAVVEASPGAGKTTALPLALVERSDQRVVVLEPRRLAARLAAERVASLLGEPVGERVGFQVRFESKHSPRTRVRFVTEGVLTRLLAADPALSAFDTVILDEVHERHLQGDLALALVDALSRSRRPDLRLVAMSATLDGEALAAHLGAKLWRFVQARFPVAIEHLVRVDRDPLETQVAKAVRRLVREGLTGHVLVFLPGMREIERAAERCAAVARDEDLALLPLHGSLPSAAQDRAVGPSDRRKVILSTNVAESSITIDGVAAVIDSGQVRRQYRAAGASLGRLRLETISKASATQRAGRAGRTGPGRCLRLYTEGELRRAPDFDTPEILRADLAEAALACRLAGRDPRALRWLTDPEAAAWTSAEALLGELGAVEAEGAVTTIGHQLGRLPLPPRLGRCLVEARRRGVEEEAAEALALVAEGRLGGDAADLPRQLAAPGAARWRRSVEQLRAAARRLPSSDEARGDREERLMAALLSGFGDRVARRRGDAKAQRVVLALAGGGSAQVVGATSLEPGGLCLVLDAEGAGGGQAGKARLLARITEGVLLDERGDEILAEEIMSYAADRERVESVARLSYRGLVLDESRGPAPPTAEATACLVQTAIDLGLALVGGPDTERFLARARHTARQAGAAFGLDPSDLATPLRDAALGMTSLDELRRAGLHHLLAAALTPEDKRLLERHAPDAVALPNGQRLSIHYPDDAPPWVESYLQDFFGLAETPALAGKPLVIRLWAPNRRPLQVTDDLAGFWERHYPDLRRSLSRRYPKHHWPDEPSSARAARLKRHV
ncbi:MAG: ATP-dependent helicase HrpB [Polyangiaceae bacterium]